MSDGTDPLDGADGFEEHGQVDEQYREPDTSSLGPNIPEAPAPPDAPDPSETDVDPVVEGTFWTLVVVFNIGLMVASIGAMLVVFQHDTALGGQLTLAGVLVLGYGFYRYRGAKQLVKERVDDADGEAADADQNG